LGWEKPARPRTVAGEKHDERSATAMNGCEGPTGERAISLWAFYPFIAMNG